MYHTLMSHRPARPRPSRRPLRYPRAAVFGVALFADGVPARADAAGVPQQSFEPEPQGDGGTEAQPAEPTQPPTEASETGLRAVLSPDGATFPSSGGGTITAEIRNEGARDEELRMDVLGVGIFALDVYDARGERIPTIPPPMPLTPQEVEEAKEDAGPWRESAHRLHVAHVLAAPTGRHIHGEDARRAEQHGHVRDFGGSRRSSLYLMATASPPRPTPSIDPHAIAPVLECADCGRDRGTW